MTGHRIATIVVVGGSLAGLTTALALARQSWHVEVLERSGPTPRTGGALAASLHELEPVIGAEHAATALGMVNGRPHGRRGDPILWASLREGLRQAVENDPLIELHHDARVDEVHDHGSSASITTADGRQFMADAVIGADGHRSLVRRELTPEHPDATYAGYSLWIGAVKESQLPTTASSAHGLFIEPSGPHYLLGYPMSDPDGRDRTLGWAWYDSTRNELFRAAGAVKGRVVQHTMRSSDVPQATLRELDHEAVKHWPSPWRDAIRASIERREVTGIPIAEYVPERLAAGRLAIVGNAAHVPTPMTGNGFAASLDDAAVLADACSGVPSAELPAALLEYERRRVAAARRLVLSGQQFSRSFALGA